MKELTIGLAPTRTSYFDQVTNTYLTLEKPTTKITYDELDAPGTVQKLDRIVHALCASVPALVLYGGVLPEASIQAWEAKYLKPFNGPTSRAIVENGKIIGHAPIAEPIGGGVDDVGQVIEPNRAFDRPKKVKDASKEVPEPLEPVTLSLDLDEEPKEETKAKAVTSSKKAKNDK